MEFVTYRDPESGRCHLHTGKITPHLEFAMNIRRFTHAASRILLLCALAAPLAAQTKRPITQDTYDQWRAVQGATLSPDGKFAMYTVSPVVGDGEVVIRATGAGTEWRFARGYTGRPQLMPAADSAALFSAPPAQFSAGSTTAAFITYAPRAEFEAARTARPRPLPQPRTSLTIVTLADGKAQVIPRVRSFRFAREGGRFLAYLLEADTAAPGTGGAAPAAAGGGRGGARPGAAAGARPDPAAPLMLRDLTTGQELKIDDVTSYLFDEGEKVLVYATASSDSMKIGGVHVRDLATGAVSTLATGKGNYRSVAVDRKGTQVAFVSDRDDVAAAKPRYALYYASLVLAKGQKGPVAAAKVVDQAMVGADQLIADRGRVDFVREGSALQFALAPLPIDSIPADSLADKAIYDLWHWKDTQIMPVQKVTAARERNRTWTAVYHPALKKWAKLGNDSLRQVTVADNGKVALALNPVQYAIEQTWGEGGNDVYVLDAATGARTLVAKKLDGAQLSPGGKYVTFFRAGKWFSHATASGKQVEITAAITGVRFDNEEFDMPDDRPSYGLGGWTTDDARVLVYDRYDAWEVDPAGVAAPLNVTAGNGRAKDVTYRVINLDSEDRFLDPAQPLMLRAFDNASKASGYAQAKLGASAAPAMLVMGPKNYAGLQKARKASQYLMTQQTFREFPDLWTGAAVNAVTKISNANPQDAAYPRGDVELVHWRNDDGVPLEGMLFKPEGFDPAKKYPMITYFYERLSDGLHNYYAPSGRNTVNPLVYNSLGYLVFMPDIVYTDGFPGPSAAKAIIPGVQSLIARGFVDPKKLGITGQSWGGYQSAYLITVTNMFAAAVPNATVVNMTSAYGGIRWQSGLLRQMQYEHSQSRIGGSLWQYPERFVENSPLFKLDRVTTPVLFMANDNDGAVPWYQGIEFYSAMRRLQKEAYLVVYNGDEHNPTKRANQKDIDLKMQQFFGAKLLGQAEPDWMKNGIPFLKKGQDQLNRR